jgi:hypothetical protein
MIAPLSAADFKIVLNPILSIQNQNAAHVEESAGASEELNAQAGRMKLTVEAAGLMIENETS